MERKKDIEKKKSQISETEKKYIRKCESEGTKFISFEEFKALYKNKLKEDALGKTKKKPKISMMKEVIKEKGNPEI